MSDPPQGVPPKHGSVLKNTLILVGAQFLGMPLALLVNGAMGRHLGPTDFGYVYLATNLCGFGFLFVEWGHGGVLPAKVAQDHSRSGGLLGSSLVWRVGSGVVVTLILSLVSWLFYPPSFVPLLALVALQTLFGSISQAYQDVARGFERTDVTAIGRIGGQVINAALILPLLFLGFGLMPVMIATVLGAALVLPIVIRRAHAVGVAKPRFDRRELVALTRGGWAFLIFATALTLQGVVDTVWLSKLASAEVMGWNSAAQKLVGILLVPASALIASLYPTLSRLFVEDLEQYRQTLRRSINGTGLLAIPLGLGCALYSGLGIAIYGKAGFAPAQQNLTVLSLMVVLFYFSMPLGSALLAAGRQAIWAWAQAGCVIVRLVLNPLLIPWFQEHYGNGGLGVSVAGVVCELGLVAVALYMIPGGVIDRALAKVLTKGALAGGAMTLVAWALGRINPWIAAPIALLTYFGALYLLGGIDTAQLRRVVEGVRNKVGARRA